MFVLGYTITRDNNINNVMLTKLMGPQSQACREHYIAKTMASQYTPSINRTLKRAYGKHQEVEKLVNKAGRGTFGEYI
jgi:hypothetical protein